MRAARFGFRTVASHLLCLCRMLMQRLVKRACRPVLGSFVPMRLPSEADLTQWEADVTSLG